MKSKGLFTSWMVGVGAILISISGCGKADVSAASPAQSATSNRATNTPAKVDGYKEFKFGMTAAQITKLDACAEQYNKLIADVKSYIAAGERFIAENKARPDPQPLENNFAVSMLDENRANLAKLEKHDETLSLDLLTKEILINRDPRHVYCSVEMFGGEQTPTLGFENGKLISVRFTVGMFNNEKFQTLHKALADKYGSIIVPTADQIASFNNKTGSAVSATYAANQILLSAEDSTYGRVIKIYYFDSSKAASVGKEATAGQVRAGDL